MRPRMERIYNWCSVTIPVGLAFLGGIAHVLQLERRQRSVWYAISCLFTSSFTGLIVYLLLAESNLSFYMLSAICGLSGNAGVSLLNALTGIPKRMLEKATGEKVAEAWSGSERRKYGRREDSDV